MGRLAAAEMQEIAKRVFGSHESTLAEEACNYQVEEIVKADEIARRIMRSTVTSLSDDAFEAQPNDADGNDVWSAGQVVSHIAGSVFWIDRNIKQMLDQEPGEPATDLMTLGVELGERPRLLDRDDSLTALDDSGREFGRVIADLPGDADLNRTGEHELFGVVSSKAWLLLDVMHHYEHINQLNQLDGAS